MHIALLPKAISAILIASTAGAYQVGNDLLDHCVGNASENVACLAYIQGAIDDRSSNESGGRPELDRPSAQIAFALYCAVL